MLKLLSDDLQNTIKNTILKTPDFPAADLVRAHGNESRPLSVIQRFPAGGIMGLIFDCAQGNSGNAFSPSRVNSEFIIF